MFECFFLSPEISKKKRRVVRKEERKRERERERGERDRKTYSHVGGEPSKM